MAEENPSWEPVNLPPPLVRKDAPTSSVTDMLSSGQLADGHSVAACELCDRRCPTHITAYWQASMRDGKLKSNDLHGALSVLTFLIHPLHLLVLASGSRDQKVVVETNHRVCYRCYCRLKICRFIAPFLFIAGIVLLVYGGGHWLVALVHPYRGLLADTSSPAGGGWLWWMLARGLFWLGIAVWLLRWSNGWFNSTILRGNTNLQGPFEMTGISELTGGPVGRWPGIFKLLGTAIPLLVIALIIGTVVYIAKEVTKKEPQTVPPRRPAAPAKVMKMMVFPMADKLGLYNMGSEAIPSVTVTINGTSASGYHYTHPDPLDPQTAVLVPLEQFVRGTVHFDPSSQRVGRATAVSADFTPVDVTLAPAKKVR